MPTYIWKNKKTGQEVELINSIAERDTAPDESGDWFRPMQAVAFTKVSYVDGQKRDDQSGYDKLRIASQLEIDKASAHDKVERGRLQKEIDKLTKVT